ncbi:MULTISPECIES: methyltransferase domain-containing protein [unclassified Streptomyces]|uniref:methyltransferase domain-containing protein n=1 Tax=unclassified Streptomyces TaxID=2593676 RepID=UPI000DC31050|nr:methyltransferase domain-containing protein [Streptomyces sp. PsTaAH-130]RAJ62999.1 methyltransferase family protein [Streptomyces sp. PsTaAH-130]
MPTSPRTLEPLLQRSFYAHHLARMRHRLTARALSSLPEPESWLDVGTGYGHFPQAAKRFFPYTSFDGVDPTDRVERALAEERVEEAYRGRLSDVAPRLRARYDVVSLFGPPADPAELHCALTVLRPGGHLVLGGTWTPADVEIPSCAILPGVLRIPYLHHHRLVARKAAG